MAKIFKKIQHLPGWFTWFVAHSMLFWRRLHPYELDDPDHLYEQYLHSDKVCVVMIWHNRLLSLPTLFPSVLRKKTYAVISASRDGQYVTDFAAAFGVHGVRGSSKKNAVSALRDAMKSIGKGGLVVFTPDGPRGPAYQIKNGPVHVASKMGIPIIPIGINHSAYWTIKSWDRFRIPKPWSKLTVRIGHEIYVPSELDSTQIELWRKKAEDELNLVSNVSPEEKVVYEQIYNDMLRKRTAKRH